MKDSDEQLMLRYCDGDTGAFDTLYRRYRGPVFRYIQRLSPAGTDIEGIYQDAWLKAISAREQWRRDQPFSPWLYRIVHNHVVDGLRRSGVVEMVDPEDLAALPHPAPSMDLLQLLRDCAERLLALLGQLPEVQRSAFLLKEEAGLSLAEIGQVTGVERETVKSRLRYALNRLRAGLEDCDD